MLESIVLFREFHNETFLFFIFLIFASIGSFLNVVIYRLPKMMDYEWMKDAEAFLSYKKIKHKAFKFPDKKPDLNGLSHCPTCNSKIPFYYNIPIFGWLILRGKTACCNNKLAFRYPLVELLFASLSTAAFAFYDLDYAILLSLSSVFLISIYFIDKDNQIIPDSILFLLAITFIIYSGYSEKIDTFNMLMDIIKTFFGLFIFSMIFSKIRNKQGLGLGDIKLISIVSGIVGLIYLPVLLLASVMASLLLMFAGSINKNDERFDSEGAIAFGPAIAIASLLLMYFYTYLKYIY